MKQQVFVIHGADAFHSYEEYITSLENKEVRMEDFKRKGWKSSLQEKLGEAYEVFMPQMPNKQNAKYREWKIYFEKFLPLLNDDVIFVGHSMGGIFLSKYFSENKTPKKVKALFLIAAPHDDESEYALGDFAIHGNLKLLQQQCPEIHFIFSKDDPVVPFSEMEKYQKVLPEAHFRIFEDRQHFNQEEFPELVEEIRGLK